MTELETDARQWVLDEVRANITRSILVGRLNTTLSELREGEGDQDG